MKISKRIHVPRDKVTDQLVMSYWENQSMSMDKKSDIYYKGKRGSVLGNLLSYDMKKVITDLSINVDNDEVICNLNINTIGQYITKYNKEYWELELDTFESVLLNNDYKEAEWKDYNKQLGKKNILSTIGIIVISAVVTMIFTNQFK